MAFKDMKDDLESLEYGKILAQIKSHASSEYGQRYLETHLPSSDIQQVEKWLKETEEAWDLLERTSIRSLSLFPMWMPWWIC